MPNISKEPYKGVRDFYPEDMYIQKYMFNVLRSVVEKYGYQEYNASILEPAELYRAKSGEEIINEQTYTFTDRGEREVTLRPEMTPTVARMIAARRRELTFPARWYSIPNLFRYERPQRGRLREHWQLNVDIFGTPSIEAEVETILIAYDILKAFGLSDENFVIKVNNREFMNYLVRDVLGIDDEESYRLSKLIDRRAKMDPEEFKASVDLILGDTSTLLLNILNAGNILALQSALPSERREDESIEKIRSVLAELEALGIKNAKLDTSIMRGFDYYTGTVFEVFDTHPDNRRSMFGGGRYDNLVELFDEEKIPAVGFGMGDVTLRDTLETYGLLPAYTGGTTLYVCIMDETYASFAQRLARDLRAQDIQVAIDLTFKKIGNQIATADKLGIPFVVCIGENEAENNIYKVKNLKTGEERDIEREEIGTYIKG